MCILQNSHKVQEDIQWKFSLSPRTLPIQILFPKGNPGTFRENPCMPTQTKNTTPKTNNNTRCTVYLLFLPFYTQDIFCIIFLSCVYSMAQYFKWLYYFTVWIYSNYNPVYTNGYFDFVVIDNAAVIYLLFTFNVLSLKY